MNALSSVWSRLRNRPNVTPEQTRKSAFVILFAVSASTAIGNTGLQSVLPAIGRQIGIPDPMVAAIFSLSALLWALTSPGWAKLSDKRGRKPLIKLGLSGFCLSMLLCALVVSAGVRHWAPPMVIFVLFLLCRALVGLVGAAANPATQAYVADTTPREQRTEALSVLAGAFGLGTIVGPLIATLFVLPVVGLAGPMFAFAAVMAAVLCVVIYRLPDIPLPIRPSAPVQDLSTTKLPLWRDPRVTPFLIYGFLASVCQTALLQILGFLIIDKVHVAPLQALDYIKMAMMMGAVVSLLGQWGLVRMFRMSPRHLLLWGAGLAAAGLLLVAASSDYWTVVIAYVLSSLGFAFTRPGFTAGASLAVGEGEQARAAGAVAVINGVNVVFAPAFVALYELSHTAPFLLCAAMLSGLLIYALVNPTLRAAGADATSEAEVAGSILERSDEGGGV